MHRLVILALLSLIAAPAARADYVVASYRGISWFSDSGEYRGSYRDLISDTHTVPYYGPAGNTGFAVGPDSEVYAVGHGGFGHFDLAQFDGTTGLIEQKKLQWQPPGPDWTAPEYVDLPPVGLSGNLLSGLGVDDNGYLWGFGRMIQQDLQLPFPDPQIPPTNWAAGWALSRMPADQFGPAEVILPLGPNGEEYHPYTRISFADNGTAYTSTKFGVIEFDPDAMPSAFVSLLDLSPVEPNGPFAYLFDSADSRSPFNASQPWMHPLLTGDLAGGWTLAPDGLLFSVRDGSAGAVLHRYDPASRTLLTPVPLEPLANGEVYQAANAFIGADGALTVPSRRSVSTSVDYRMNEIDWQTGLRTKAISLDADWKDNWITGAVYLPSVPEPTAAALSLMAIAGVAARRRG